MKFILGKKIEMTELWDSKGRSVPVTIIEAGPCYVTQLRTNEKDGYGAIQLGFSAKGGSASGGGAPKRLTKAMQEHLKDLPKLRWIKECRMQNLPAQAGAECRIGDREVKRGDAVDVSIFNVGDKVKVTGTSKGKGFQGVVKRHGFHGHPSTHGHKDQERMPGAIGAGGMQHVRKGQKMAGRMGGGRVSVRSLEVIAVDQEKNQMIVKGAVPGARGSLVMIVA